LKRLAPFVLSLLLPATAVATTIEDAITVWRWVVPDLYALSVEVKAEGKREAEVLNALKRADDLLRETGLEYRGGNYNLQEVREWEATTKKYRLAGFRGSAVYTFLLKSPKEQEKVLRALERAKGFNRFIYKVRGARWELSWERRAEALKELKLKALKEALKEANLYGRELRQRCTLNYISYSHNFRPLPPILPVEVKPLGKKVGAPSPVPFPNRVEVKARLKIECE